MAMLKIGRDERLKRLGWTMLLQIHDEVILEGPEEAVEEAMSYLVRRIELMREDLGINAETGHYYRR